MSSVAGVLTSTTRMGRTAARTVTFSISTAIYFVLGTAIIPVAIFKWAPHTREVYFAVLFAMAVSGLISLLLAFRSEMVRLATRTGVHRNGLARWTLNVSPYLFIGLFGALAYLHYKVFGGFVLDGPVTVNLGRMGFETPLNWLMFVAENLSSAIFLDLMEAYKFKFSSLDYTTPLFGTVVFVFRFVVGIYFWKIIYNMLRHNIRGY